MEAVAVPICVDTGLYFVSEKAAHPEEFIVNVKDKVIHRESIILHQEKWEHEDDKMQTGCFASRDYAFLKEAHENARGKMAIEVVAGFAAKDEKTVTADKMKAIINGKDYTYRLTEAKEGKAEVHIVVEDGKNTVEYPIDVIVTEVATIVFNNREKTERPPETPSDPLPSPDIPRVSWISRASIGMGRA